MRFATLVDQRRTPPLSVTVTKLSNQAGTLLANVNRWRQQIGLTEMQENDLDQCTRALEADNLTGVLVDLTSASSPASTPAPQRMLAAIFETPEATWFFKATDTHENIDAAEADLLALFASAGVEHSSPTPPLPGGIDITQPNSADSKLLTYTVPEGWRDDPMPRTARIATLVVDAEGKTELAITRFPGDVGGELANVNRWRGQLGLMPVSSLALQPSSDVTIANHPARMYELIGETNPPSNLAMTVALVKHTDHTWFFKMTGPASTVAQERERFKQFLESVRLNVSP